MNHSLSPRPPKWPYFLGDALLLALACLVGTLSESPLSNVALSAIFGCVALGCVLAVLPYLFDFFADQRTAVVEFQQKLEAQNARLVHGVETLAATAAQLKAAHEAAAKAVHAADTLPYRLQEKIAEFTGQLQERDDEEKAAMTKELDALRDTEGQRLTALVGTIQTATKEFAALEKEARASIEAARHEVAESAPALAAALGAATTRAEAALNQSAMHAQTAITAVETKLHDTIAAAEAVASRLLERTAALRQLEQEIDIGLQQKIDQLNAATRAIETATHSARRQHSTTGDDPAAAESAASGTGAAAEPAPAAALPVMQLTAFPRMKRDPIAPRAADPSPEPTAMPVAAIGTASVVAPAAATATTAAAPVAPTTAPVSSEPAAEPPAAASEAAPKREPRRKSSSRSVGEAVLPGFAEPEIVYDAEPATHSAPAKTADGATRLLVTAYIGIGNKVFIRGEGPGLSWEKGTPMEFVSIGKWSWETADAVDPLKIQLYKNDDLAAQGEAISLPPGHHVEATPVFREPDPF